MADKIRKPPTAAEMLDENRAKLPHVDVLARLGEPLQGYPPPHAEVAVALRTFAEKFKAAIDRAVESVEKRPAEVATLVELSRIGRLLGTTLTSDHPLVEAQYFVEAAIEGRAWLSHGGHEPPECTASEPVRCGNPVHARHERCYVCEAHELLEAEEAAPH
jgi:hypothetical protein